MNPEEKFDLKKHTLPKVSQKYIVKMMIYIVILLGVLTYFFYFFVPNKKQKQLPIKEIRNIQIQIDTLN